MTDTIRTNFKRRAAAVAVASCLSFAPWLAEAASLGKITVLSGLGQPLRAEIEISASRAELAGMTARLADQKAFREAGIDYSSTLHDLRFAIGKRSNGTPVIKVSSGNPVNEPFLDFLVELNWPSGPVVREYTFLLDPPEMAARAAGRPATADARVVDTVRGSGAAPATGAVPEAARPAPAPRAVAEPKKTDESGSRVVQRGDTLRKIAGETKYEGVSLEQMLVGLFKKNPAAFSGDNMNRLKAGAIINVPDRASVAAEPQAEAKKFYEAQAQDWNSYRQKMASLAAKGQPTQDAAAQTAAGKIAASVAEKPSAVDQAKDQVRVSSTEMASKGVAGGKASAAVEADLIAKDRSLKEAQERLALLEKNVSELQKLVDMKTQQLAELQERASGRREDAKPATPVEPPKPVASVEPPKAAEPAAPAVEAPKPSAVEAAKPTEPPKAVEEAKPAEPPNAAEVKPQEQPAKPAAAPAPGFLEQFDALPLIGGGGILALLAGYFLFRRRRSEPEPEFTAAVPGPSSLGPNSVFRMTGGHSVDTGNVPLETRDFSMTGPGTIDTDEVDPVAEADVYMAYGRDAQAEEILIEALRKDPHRTAIHAKLLEIYANRKSVKQFDTLASELYAQTGGIGPEWEKVATLGAALDPENPLYADGRDAAPAEVGAAPVTAPSSSETQSTVLLPGTLGVMAAGLGGLAAAASEVTAPEDADALGAVAAGAAGEYDHVLTNVSGDLGALDFELGETEQIAAFGAPAAEPVADIPLPQLESLDFDLESLPQESLSETEVNPNFAPTETLVMGTGAAADDLSETFTGLETQADFSASAIEAGTGLLDFDLGDTTADTETIVHPSALHDGSSGDMGGDTVVNPMDIQESGRDALSVVDGTAGMSVDFAAEDAEFDINLSESVFLGRPMPVPEFDLTSINLDLTANPAEETEVVDLAEGLDNLDNGKAVGDQGAEDVATKLALAKAYEEMGDHDQARELLEEVIAEGGEGDLAEQARQILGRLNA